MPPKRSTPDEDSRSVGHVHGHEDASHNPSVVPDGAVPGAEPRDETDAVERGKRFGTVAGPSAAWQTLRYVWGNLGAVEGTESLLKVNKLDGFDRQSCAWPSLDKNREAAEFCGKGAPAIGDEGTRARVTPESFKQHSMSYLLTCTDFRAEYARPPDSPDGFT